MKDEKDSQNEAENIRVAVRCRPMNDRELREQAVSCFKAEHGNAVLTNLENPSERHEFGFDHVYGIDIPQVTVFNDIGAPILDRAFGGYNGTIFAYGQTGSGKTFSMSGVRGHDELEGLIPRMNRAIFERIQREKTENPQKLFLVECSFFEIYNEIIYDLLDSSGNAKKNKGGLEIKEHAVLGIYVKDLQERVVESREEVIDLMQQGQNARTVGYTQMNSESSRSHSIFIIKIHQKDATDETKNIFAKINLVDLAGSERAASTGAQGDRLKEGANINKSLSALGNVINALVEASRAGKKVFIPYRNSKLTRVLQESLGGNSLCSMLATLSPANINFVETLSTLKYASRAKSIKVNAKKNEASSQISQLNEEIAALKKKLTEQTSSTLGLDPKEKDEIVKKYEQQIKEMDRVRLQTWEDKAKLSKQHEMERKRLAKEKALADQKVREERTRKWKLLEEKGDVELMLRALRDLDRTSSAAGCAPVEDKWLVRSQTMKSLETEAKDHRTMVVVFKDAIDKDVDHWAKRLVRQDSTVTAAARRDDTAATHMIVNQLCSKLQNVFDESKQLVEMEKKLTEDGRELINEMMTVLTVFKEKRKAAKSAPPLKPAAAGTSPASAAEAQRGREDDQIQEEREKGLSMTLALILRQRAKLIATIKTERQKMFGLAKVCTHFTKYIDSFIAAFGAVKDADSTASIEKWTAAKENLAKASAVWESEWAKGQAIEETADSVPVTYTPKGEVAALGLESKLIPDDCLYPSSRKADAKLLRMNSPNFWIPDESDAVAFAVVDLEFPRFVQSISVRGGNTAGSAPIATSTTPQPGGSSSLVPVTTFELKPTDELLEIVKMYKLDKVSGEHESTHEIMGHVMSWQDLLKTTLLPTKLFARPPIRFLHDVISVVIHNTGYAKDLFSPSERDYVNLTSKTQRVDYLTKILDFVQEDYRSLDGGPTVMIAATASNIFAGKEPTDTLKFLCYFSLAALQWAIKNPPVKAKKLTDGETSTEGSPRLSAEGSSGAVDPAAPQDDGESQNPSGRSGWVKKMRISTSLTGRTWRILGDFDSNTDDTSLQMISFPPGTNAVGRFVQLTCIEWHELPLFQVEIYGQEASESDELVKTIESMGVRASAMVQQLQASASLFAEEARASWEKAKDAEREKQEELIKLMAEITRLKQSNAEFEKEIKELQQSKTTLQQNVKTETKRLAEEKAKCDKLQGELQQNTTSIADIKKEKEALSVKLNEHAHSIQTMTLQLSTQTKELESLQKSKTGLEELCSTLRTQLQAKSQEEGHQESKLASVMSDLMAVNVQLDEYRRRYESSEQMRKEQEAANQQMHTQLQDQLTQLSEKERLAQKLLNEKVVEAGRSLEAIQTEKDEIRRKLDDMLAAATASNAANEALRTQMSALQDELEVWKSKVAEAQPQACPTKAAIEAANAASTNASQQASEQMMLEAQTKELRCIAELEKMELKVQSYEQKQREAESKLVEVEAERNTLSRRITELEELEDELQMQLQVVTEERDAARAKEEQLFVENNEKEQEIERIRDGYVWVTDRMNSKEDELAEMQEQLEKYQALLQITATPGKKKDSDNAEIKHLVKLYALATGQSDKQASTKPEDLVKELTLWIENAKSIPVPSQAKPSSPAAAKTDQAVKTATVTAASPAQQPPAVSTTKPSTVASPAPASVDTAVTSSPPARAKTPRHDETTSAKPTTTSVSTPEAEAPKVLIPKVKAMPESNQAASKEVKDELPKRAKSPREPHQPEASAAAKPEMDVPAPTKPAAPRREASPPTSARKVNGSNGTAGVAPSNQLSQRPKDTSAVDAAAAGADDAYDDDFDTDEPDEAKKRVGRKASAKTVQPAQ